MQDDFSLEAYDYVLPDKNIAQHPATERDGSKLLVLNNTTGEKVHHRFSDIVDFFAQGDILVINDTKVFPARLFGKKETGGKAEVFLLELPREIEDTAAGSSLKHATTTALIKSSKRPLIGSKITLTDRLSCSVRQYLENGKAQIDLHYPAAESLIDILAQCGSVPLPPYIERSLGILEEDKKRYQTVYAAATGAVAAPTAGLHFTKSIFDRLRDKNVDIVSLTLHVGYGTFAPVRTEAIKEHNIHSEYVSIPADSAALINRTKKNGGKVWAVGTTTVRALEFCCDDSGTVRETNGWCDLYIIPGFNFQVIDNLITNFHLPKSSLLFLVSALCGRKKLLECYREAIARDYRFYSYGDAMAILS